MRLYSIFVMLYHVLKDVGRAIVRTEGDTYIENQEVDWLIVEAEERDRASPPAPDDVSEHEHEALELTSTGVDEAAGDGHDLESIGVETEELVLLDVLPEENEDCDIVNREPREIGLQTVVVVGEDVASRGIEDGVELGVLGPAHSSHHDQTSVVDEERSDVVNGVENIAILKRNERETEH